MKKMVTDHLPLVQISFVFLLFSFSINSKALDVLYLGDSQSVGFFGGYVSDFLKNPMKNCGLDNQGVENQVDFFAISGSSPRHWTDQRNRADKKAWLCSRQVRTRLGPSGNFSAPDYIYGTGLCRPHTGVSVLERIIQGNQPDVAVINFSANSVGFRNSQDFENAVRAMINQLPPGTPCVWITNPPTSNRVVNTQKMEETQEKIRAILEDMGSSGQSRCTFIPGVTANSKRDFTNNPSYLTRDGLHLNNSGARYWFEDLVKPEMCSKAQTLFNHTGTTGDPARRSQEN